MHTMHKHVDKNTNYNQGIGRRDTNMYNTLAISKISYTCICM